MSSFWKFLKLKQSLSAFVFVSSKILFASINSDWTSVTCDNNTELFALADGLLTGPLSIQPTFVSKAMGPSLVFITCLLIIDQ